MRRLPDIAFPAGRRTLRRRVPACLAYRAVLGLFGGGASRDAVRADHVLGLRDLAGQAPVARRRGGGVAVRVKARAALDAPADHSRGRIAPELARDTRTGVAVDPGTRGAVVRCFQEVLLVVSISVGCS